jgi:CheY-like chemotaxis protein
MEGTGVLRQLKQDPVTKSIPVIILSGLSQKNETKLKRAGASAYFQKSLLNLDKEGSEQSQERQQLRGTSRLVKVLKSN